MYKIIGSDQKEYGPVTTEQLHQWIAQGRVTAQTRVQAEGGAEWRACGDYAEFAEALTTSKSPLAGVLPPLPPATATAPTSRMAIWSLVLGVVGFFCGLPALAGLILGFVSMNKIKRSNGAVGGGGLALAGTIVSGACLLLYLLLIPILAAMLLPALAQAKSRAQTINCVNNLKQLGLAVRLYANDNKDQLPAATNWCDTILPNVGSEKVFLCPAARPGPRSHYAFNARLGSAEIGKIAPDTVMIFETDGGWNLSGGPELMLQRPRHGRTFVVGLADGSVQQINEGRLGQLRWEP